MEKLLKKVEETIDELQGFSLYHCPKKDGYSLFSKTENLFYICGIRFAFTAQVLVYDDGRVEYDINEHEGSTMRRKELMRVLKEKSGLIDWRLEKLCDDITTAVEAMMESLHASLGMQLERALPEVEIIDRFYCH